MSNKYKIYSSTLIYLVGDVGSKIISIFLFPVYSFFLTKEQMGVYDLMLVIINISLPIITLQISQAVYRWLIGANDSFIEKEKIITNGFISISLLLVVALLIVFVLGYYSDNKYYLYYVFIISLNIYLVLLQQIARGFKLLKVYAYSGIINAFFTLLLSLYFLIVLDYGINGIFLSMVISMAISVFYLVYKTRFYSFIRLKLFLIGDTGELVSYSFPLVLNNIGWWLINFSNKFVILFYIGIEANGIYAVSSKIPSIVNLLGSVFILAWQDFMIESKNSNENALFVQRLFEKYADFLFSIVFVIIPGSFFAALFFVDKVFFESWTYMPILSMASVFSLLSAYVGAIYLREKMTQKIFTTSLIGGLVSIASSFLLIDALGLYGPAIGVFLGFFAVFFLRVFYLRNVIRIKINYLRMSLWLFAFLAAFLIMVIFENLYIRAYLMIFALTIFLIINYRLYLNFKE